MTNQGYVVIIEGNWYISSKDEMLQNINEAELFESLEDAADKLAQFCRTEGYDKVTIQKATVKREVVLCQP